MITTTGILKAFPTSPIAIFQIRRRRGRRWFLSLGILFSFSVSLLLNTIVTTKVEAGSQRVKQIEINLPEGTIPKTLKFPVYEQNSIQYFSAGLGKEERSLKFPPFPLKLIFVQGERAYLAGVSILLTNKDGTPLLNIPGNEVEGPWLFINAPIGTYVVNGTNSKGKSIEKTITIKAAEPTIVHFRFP